MIKISLLKVSILISSIIAVASAVQIKGADTQKWISEVPLKDVENSAIYRALSNFGGQNYVTTICGRDLEGVKKWKEGEELPISISSVKTISQKTFKQNFAQFSQFKITSINLLHLTLVDDWLVQVEFSDTDAAASEDKKINLIVLLNGRVIMPAESAN